MNETTKKYTNRLREFLKDNPRLKNDAQYKNLIRLLDSGACDKILTDESDDEEN